mgnify:CR=1 FL=1
MNPWQHASTQASRLYPSPAAPPIAPLVHHVAGRLVAVQERRVAGVRRHQLESLIVELQGGIVFLLGKAAVAIGLQLSQRLGSLHEVATKPLQPKAQ